MLIVHFTTDKESFSRPLYRVPCVGEFVVHNLTQYTVKAVTTNLPDRFTDTCYRVDMEPS